MQLSPPTPYYETHTFTVKINQEQVDLVTKPGVPDWELAEHAIQLFADQIGLEPKGPILLYGSHMAGLAVCLARKYPQVKIYLTDHIHTPLAMAQLSLAANRVSSVHILYDAELPDSFRQKIDLVYMLIPKGRQLARRWLVQTFQALAPPGRLYLAGANRGGIQSVIKDAQALFGGGKVLAYRKGNRLAQFIRTSAELPVVDWLRQPGITPGTWVKFPIEINKHTLHIHSLPGVFSYDRLDEGTNMLLNSLDLMPGWRVLDVGCGYGVLGLYAAFAGAGTVHLVDNNLLAIAACKETLAANGITTAELFAGDLLEPVSSHTYDLIISNPPFHSGQAVDYQIAAALIDQSYHALSPGGRLSIVANRFIPYDRLIVSVFGNVSIEADSGRYRVLSGLKFIKD